MSWVLGGTTARPGGVAGLPLGLSALIWSHWITYGEVSGVGGGRGGGGFVGSLGITYLTSY